MEVISYNPKYHKQIIKICVAALKEGKTVVYPTDTSYGICCDLTNPKARKKFYQIKERNPKQPVHVIVPSLAYSKTIVKWNAVATKLAKAFWPGPISLVLPLKKQSGPLPEFIKIISGGTGSIGLRRPDNKVAADLARQLGKPIPATSANPSAHLSGGYDSYSSTDVIAQFKKQKYKPDIIIDAGQLRKNKPSTMLKINVDNKWEILRPGPITKTQIKKILNDSQT